MLATGQAVQLGIAVVGVDLDGTASVRIGADVILCDKDDVDCETLCPTLEIGAIVFVIEETPVPVLEIFEPTVSRAGLRLAPLLPADNKLPTIPVAALTMPPTTSVALSTALFTFCILTVAPAGNAVPSVEAPGSSVAVISPASPCARFAIFDPSSSRAAATFSTASSMLLISGEIAFTSGCGLLDSVSRAALYAHHSGDSLPWYAQGNSVSFLEVGGLAISANIEELESFT